ncbi:54S ribosomal protein L3 mitochondrial [Malassezia japonica]|uniref:Large ribosomal subunit protein mL44 n=1 Tax=Malassezia japonica TaxID=223818 RepID=A0AAF0FAK4_9BASI|nr:54S ribosomal protein L3 mitochondrial [Malassezia japonica]WFD41332.1 54S ribosomal protein L3 mitochondrial [Malassezia japonica]
MRGQIVRAFSTASVWRNATPVANAVEWHGAGPVGHLPQLARSHPQIWASLKAQVPSAIATVGARFHLFPSTLSADERVRRAGLVRVACTHPSVLSVQRSAADLPLSTEERQQVPELSETLAHNAELATLGNALLGLIASEYFHLKYPHLPTRVLKAFVSAFVGPSTLADVGADLGVLGQGVQRWDRTGQSVVQKAVKGRASSTAPLLSKDVAAQSMRAMVAVLFQELGMEATRGFVHSQFLSRRMDLASLLKFRDPKRVLSATCKKYNKPTPQSRILAETGRKSISPVFVVGVYSGAVKLGEGTGSSIRMAEFRAAEDALRRLYLAERPNGSFDLPSSTLDDTFAGSTPVPHSLQHAAGHVEPHRFAPQPLGRAEVLYDSRG